MTIGNIAVQVMNEISEWKAYRQCGDLTMKQSSSVTAAREATTLRLLASAADPPLNSLRDLFALTRARAELDRMRRELKSKSDSEAPLAYQGACLLARVARSSFFPCRGQPVSGQEIGALEKLCKRYSPKGWRDVTPRLANILRRFANADRAERLLRLPETLVGQLPVAGALDQAHKRLLTKALALRIAMEVPMQASFLAALSRAQMREDGDGRHTHYTAKGEAAGELSPAGATLYKDYCDRVLYQNSHVFPGRDGRSLAAHWLREQMVEITKEHVEVGLSIADLRWVIAFIQLAYDAGAADLVRGYLGQRGNRALEPLLKLVDDWRRSGALDGYPSDGGATDADDDH